MSGAADFDWVAASEASRFAAAWRDLAARAEPNAFAEPDFLLPAFAHLAPKSLQFATLWSDARRTRLIAVAAIRPGTTPLSFAQVWRHELAASPAIMVDRDSTHEVVTWLKAALKSRGAGLLISGVELSSTVGQALVAASAEIVDRTTRAALTCGPGADFALQLPAKRRKEWGRQRRRLEDGGKLAFAIEDKIGGLDAFLTLEAAGWKGKRGTALIQRPNSAAFVRAMVKNFATRGAVHVATLRKGNALIAAGIVLRSGGRGFFWKTAFDEAHAALSPGVQLTLQLSTALEKAPDLDAVDSCAIADHPMIDRLWPERLQLADFALPLGSDPWGFRVARVTTDWSRALKAAAKRILKR